MSMDIIFRTDENMHPTLCCLLAVYGYVVGVGLMIETMLTSLDEKVLSLLVAVYVDSIANHRIKIVEVGHQFVNSYRFNFNTREN